ncbi:MAG TPA: NAD(P)-dependent oxidoreductase [Nocardioidaceae bacterium]
MKVAVIGATGVIGRAAVPALSAAGHDVVALARTPEKALLLRGLGCTPVQATLADRAGLVDLFGGCDVVCNFATHVPVGYSAAWRRSWRENDWLRTEGVRTLVTAAREAGVRRFVQESVSFLYADRGDEWITEDSPLDINPATEPASVGESHVQEFQCGSRYGVVLRFGTIVGNDDMTRWMLRAAAHGRAIGLGSPDGWVHPVHTDDIGPAVVAAVGAPSGVYNVGAEPVRRADLVQGFAEATGRDRASFLGPVLLRLAGPRVEPLTRSLRVSSEHFTALTGWMPRRAGFDASWFDVIDPRPKAYQ